MGCNCKKDNNLNIPTKLGEIKLNKDNKFFKFLLFSLMIPILFLAIPVIIVLLFKIMVIGETNYNITEFLINFSKNKLKIGNEDDDFDDIIDDVEELEEINLYKIDVLSNNEQNN